MTLCLIARDGEQVSDATPGERFRSIAGEITDHAQAGSSPTLAEAEEALELLRRDAREASQRGNYRLARIFRADHESLWSAIAACRMQRREAASRDFLNRWPA